MRLHAEREQLLQLVAQISVSQHLRVVPVPEAEEHVGNEEGGQESACAAGCGYAALAPAADWPHEQALQQLGLGEVVRAAARGGCAEHDPLRDPAALPQLFGLPCSLGDIRGDLPPAESAEVDAPASVSPAALLSAWSVGQPAPARD